MRKKKGKRVHKVKRCVYLYIYTRKITYIWCLKEEDILEKKNRMCILKMNKKNKKKQKENRRFEYQY